MKIDWSFPRQVLITAVVVAVLGAYPTLKFGGPDVISPVLAGAILAFVNVILGYAAIEYSFDKSAAVFFKYVLGGMGLRMVLMAGVLVTLLKAEAVPAGPFIGSLAFFYVTFLILEILYMQKKVNARNNQPQR